MKRNWFNLVCIILSMLLIGANLAAAALPVRPRWLSGCSAGRTALAVRSYCRSGSRVIAHADQQPHAAVLDAE